MNEDKNCILLGALIMLLFSWGEELIGSGFKEIKYKVAKNTVEKWVENTKRNNRNVVYQNGELTINSIPACHFEDVELFLSIFNDFDNDAKSIIYYSFFQKRMNEWTAQKLNISIAKLKSDKRKAVVEFAEALEIESFMRD